MKYKVALYRSEEGYSVSVPGLPGCCSKGATEEEALTNIAHAIRTVNLGDAIVDGQLFRIMLQQALHSGALCPAPAAAEGSSLSAVGLTDQEMRILALVGEGLSNKAIAAALTISRNTVKTHLYHAFQKLGLSDRTQAALWIIRHPQAV